MIDLKILDSIPVILFIINDKGLVTFLNNAASDFVGEKKEKYISKNFLDRIISDKSIILDILNKPNEQILPKSLELKVKGNNNKSFYTFLSIDKFSQSDSQQNLFIVSIVDLTNQEMRSEILKESQFRFENIANSAPVMIWISDVDGMFNFVNKVWCDFTGRTLGDELGLNWVQDVHPDEGKTLLDIYNKALETRTTFSFEFRFKRKDNIYRWLIINGVPRFNSEENFLGLIGTCLDINTQKENEEYINKVNTELESANKNKDKFFSIISHDLRSPLSGIMSLLELIVSDYDSLSEDEKKEILYEAAKSSKSTFNLMENLLEWSRVQTGKMSFAPQNISLTLIINTIKNLYYQKLKEKEISLNFDFDKKFFAYADLQITETIIRNLISNAIKFTPELGIILISFENLDDKVMVKIKDTGVGMDENQISKLFKPEISSSSVGTAGERGTGLGLILCKELVEMQKGKIWVESTVGSGTTFFFTVPKAK